MKNKTLSIDFEIIWRSTHGHLSDEEQLLLDRWLEEDPGNRNYYQQVRKYLTETKLEPVKADVSKLWHDVAMTEESRHSAKKKKRLLLSIAASIAVLITSIISYPYLIGEFTEKQAAVQPPVYPLPGQHKAILHLDNGKQLALGAEIDSGPANSKQMDNVLEINKKSLRYKKHKSSLSNGPTRTHLLEVPRGGEFMLTLSDETRVWLNSQSTLKYPVSFDQEKRVVELTGEAYFEVSHHESKPFEVISGGQTLSVLGTSFNVNCYPEEKKIISTLVEGKIRIHGAGSSQVYLSPGDQTIYDRNQQSFQKQQVNTENFIAWKNGLFYFQNKPLDHIMKVLSRWYEMEVFYKDPDKRKIRFTGALKRYESFKEVIGLIEMTDDVKFTIKENVIIIE